MYLQNLLGGFNFNLSNAWIPLLFFYSHVQLLTIPGFIYIYALK